MKENKPNIILLGAGGHCISVIDVIEQENKYNILGILDNEKKIGEKILNYEIIGNDNDLEKFINDNTYFLITVGQIKSPKIRLKLGRLLEDKKAKIATVVAPTAYVSKHAKISKGTIVMHCAIVNAKAEIGEHCIINTKSNIEHNSKVGNYCHISTGVMVNGDATIGKETFIGSNATISNGVSIKERAIISAGNFIK